MESKDARSVNFRFNVWIAFALFLNLLPGQLVAEGAPLWRQTRWEGRLPASPETVRSIAVIVDTSRLRSRENARFTLMLPDRSTLAVTKIREEQIRDGFLWHGKVQTDPLSSVTFSIVKNAVAGSIVTKGKLYRVRFAKERIHFVEELDPKKFPREAEPEPVSGKTDKDIEADTCASDGPGEIDVMVVYTAAARSAAGGVDAMEATIYLALAETNQAYINSNITQRLRLVHASEVSYTESGNSMTDRDRLKNKTDGQMDGVHALRDNHGADAVVLITNSLEACGRAYLMSTVGNAFESSAFAVVKRSCASGNYSFGHELAHVMSARHDWFADSTNNSPYMYNHGHTQPTPTNMGVTPWRTVMAYDDACLDAGTNCTRIQYFSNPAVTWNGDATGAGGVQQEDNQSTLDNTALTVANFRCSSPGAGNVWMKDTWSDTGAEPDPAQATLAMWQSPYIWVRTQQDSSQIHQHEHQNPEFGEQNYIYTKLHNGSNSAASGNLELYMASAATGLSWPSDWTLVASKPVGSFNAHKTKIVETSWNPPAKGHYCLLARWVSPADPMTTPETTSIDGNTRGNNNIVWRNVDIVDLVKDSGDEADFLVRNTNRDQSVASLKIQPSGKAGSFLAIGKVVLELDERLIRIWKGRGKGFTQEGFYLTIVDSNGAVLEGLELPGGFEGKIKIQFTRPQSGYPGDTFYLDIVQMIGGRQIGGITYEIHTDRVEK